MLVRTPTTPPLPLPLASAGGAAGGDAAGGEVLEGAKAGADLRREGEERLPQQRVAAVGPQPMGKEREGWGWDRNPMSECRCGIHDLEFMGWIFGGRVISSGNNGWNLWVGIYGFVFWCQGLNFGTDEIGL